MRFSFFVALLFFTAAAHANFLTGGWLNARSGSVYYPSAIEACKNTLGGDTAAMGYSNWRVLPHSNPTVRVCMATYKNPQFPNNAPQETNSGNVWYVAGTCEEGTTLNPDTLECEGEEPNPCEDKAGQETKFSMAGKAPDANFGVNNGSLVPKTRHACISSCVVELASSPCKTWASGHYKCSGLAFFTGQQCGSESKVEGTASDTTPEVEKTDIPCKYETVNGVQVCTSQKTVDKQGKSCGQVNGQDVCVDKEPERDDVKIETTVKTEPTPDGGSKTTTKNEATVTKCKGINNCKTTTTTTTKTETKDSSGNTTDSKTICTGPHCGSGGDDDDGDGLGDCIGPSCAEVRSGGQGEGDGEGFEDVPDYLETLTAFMDRVRQSPIAQAATNIAPMGAGSCSMPSKSIPIIGTVSAQGMCDLAHVLNGLRYVFLALFGFVAVRVVMSA